MQLHPSACPQVEWLRTADIPRPTEGKGGGDVSPGKRPLDFIVQFFYYVYKAGITQLVECKLPKLDAAGSSPVSRSITP